MPVDLDQAAVATAVAFSPAGAASAGEEVVDALSISPLSLPDDVTLAATATSVAAWLEQPSPPLLVAATSALTFDATEGPVATGLMEGTPLPESAPSTGAVTLPVESAADAPLADGSAAEPLAGHSNGRGASFDEVEAALAEPRSSGQSEPAASTDVPEIELPPSPHVAETREGPVQPELNGAPITPAAPPVATEQPLVLGEPSSESAAHGQVEAWSAEVSLTPEAGATGLAPEASIVPELEAATGSRSEAPSVPVPEAAAITAPPVEDEPVLATATDVIELPPPPVGGDSAATVVSVAPPAEPPTEPPAPPDSSAPPPPPDAPPPEEEEEEGASMTIIEHLEELRRRITRAAISVVVGAVASWIFVPRFVQFLQDDVRSLGFNFFNPNVLGPLALNIKLAFLGGLILASPVVFYQIWAFVAPGLTRKERRYALPFSLIGGALFAAGAVTAVIIIPLALKFLVSFFKVFDLVQLLDINSYIMFIALIAVIFGVTFELPIFMVGFSLLGLTTSRFFIQKFKLALFIIYGVAMVITPGADFISPMILGTFLILLYWLGVLLIRFTGR